MNIFLDWRNVLSNKKSRSIWGDYKKLYHKSHPIFESRVHTGWVGGESALRISASEKLTNLFLFLLVHSSLQKFKMSNNNATFLTVSE